MFKKLRANYMLSNVLVRIAFVLFYVLYRWQTALAATALFTLPGKLDLAVALLSSAILGTVLMFLLPLFVNLLLNLSHFYSVPRAEYNLLVHLFFTFFFLACGLFNLVHLFTPLLLVWGTVLFQFVAGAVCMLLFYRATVRLYFNDVTAPYYFRMMWIVASVLAVLYIVGGVL